MFIYKEVTSSVTSNEFFDKLGFDFILKIRSVVSFIYDGRVFTNGCKM